jgi:hypothetical protein
MIILSSTTDKLQALLNAAVTANHMPIITSYRDITTTGFTASRKVINTNGVTAVDIVDVPASNTQRVIDYISVYNADTAVKTITIRYNANGTNYTLYNAIIGVNERLEYVDGAGWNIYTVSGAKRLAQNNSNNVITEGCSVGILASDVTNNSATANTISNITGLGFPITAGKKYWFKFFVQFAAAATTTGSRWSINTSGGTISNLIFRSEYSLTTTTKTINEGLTAVDTPAAANATSAAVAGNVAIIEGWFDCATTGNIIGRFASEVLSSAIVAKAGSIVLYQQLN